jgi:hypothetical protein
VKHLVRVLVLVSAVAGCAAPPQPAGPPPLDAHLVVLVGDGSGSGSTAALSDRPVPLTSIGWHGSGDDPLVQLPPADPARAYLTVTSSTRCRVPTGVEVRRSADDLQVTFTGGVEYPECVRGVQPAALLDLAAADVAGVRTVNGRPIRPA